MMVRTFVAVAAVSGSLALGAAGVVGTAGVAGASTAATPSATSPATLATRCAKAEKVVTRIDTFETKAAAWLPKAEAREARATAAGHTKLAQHIARRIARVQKREARDKTLLAKISAKCGSSTSTS